MKTSAVILALGATASVAMGEHHSNFETQFLTMTNSLGVVTGQPTYSRPQVVTSQPALITGYTTRAPYPGGNVTAPYPTGTGVMPPHHTPGSGMGGGVGGGQGGGMGGGMGGGSMPPGMSPSAAQSTLSTAGAANNYQVGGGLVGLAGLIAALV